VGLKNPKIALMSIGEEEEKGNELIKTTYNLLKSMDINFIGNVEGKEVYFGEADLIVTDGFTGNVTLKVSEGVVDVMLSILWEIWKLVFLWQPEKSKRNYPQKKLLYVIMMCLEQI
jgi:glycerol-3-phosphate acyltransferase PlsX